MMREILITTTIIGLVSLTFLAVLWASRYGAVL